MRIEVKKDCVEVSPSQGLGHFTEWECAALQANGFQREGDVFVSTTPGAEYAARMIKQGGMR